jgi:predicted CopG family antitoxin
MTKVISLSDEAYADLAQLKQKGESFSDVVVRLSKKEKKPLSEFFGKWSGSKEELNKIEKEIYETRKKTKMRDVEF